MVSVSRRLSNKRAVVLGLLVCALGGMGAVLYGHAVDNTLTAEDREYIPRYLVGVEPLPATPTFADELRYIQAVQRAVQTIAHRSTPLPKGQKREPKQLYEAGSGLCYDRSRAIEKILRYAGFESRHIAMYSTLKTGSALRSVLTRGTTSHAVSEVRTQKGWLIVGANTLWVSLDRAGQPVSMQSLQASLRASRPISWANNPINFIYTEPFTFIYGLYSRQGQFYPPYNFIPDVEYDEFIQNLWPV